jgi:beta-glucosidase-like glycosyl hydrolase
VCLTGGDFVPFVFNESSADCLTVAVDGAMQTVPLLSSLPDVHTAAAVLRKGLTGVRVDIIRGNNSARNATSPVESLQLTCISKGSSTFVQIDPACENCSRGALLFGVGGAGGGAANGFVGTDPTPNITMDDINDSVQRILSQMLKVGIMDAGPGAFSPHKVFSNASSETHIRLARKLGSAGQVLVKNDAGLLPLPKSGKRRSIAVLGLAVRKRLSCDILNAETNVYQDRNT